MKPDREKLLLRAHFWMSVLIAFGLGHLTLSRMDLGIVAAFALTGLGAAGKTVVHSLLEKHYRNSNAGNV